MRNRKGFTLIELIVTIAILAFGCFAALSMQHSAIRTNVISNKMTAAVFIAESEAERLKAYEREELLDYVAAAGNPVTWMTDNLGRECPYSTEAECRQRYPFKVTTKFYDRYPTVFSTLAEIDVDWHDNTGPHGVSYVAVMTSLSF
jgi:prepilin-type N-terminal cleavage/methylation domain-containing protein